MTAELIERLERGETLAEIVDDVYSALGLDADRWFIANMNDFIAADAWESFAIALVERVVGVRHTWSITSPQYNRDSQYRASDWTAHIWCPQKRHGWHAENRHSGPAALIAALLKAEAK